MLQEIKNWKRNIKDRNGVNMANKKKKKIDMWQMRNPLNFFEKELHSKEGRRSFVGAIMLKSKYDEFPERDRKDSGNGKCRNEAD